MADDTRGPGDEMAGIFNLMAHPMAGVAAASAIGAGMAAQMLGMWVGAIEGSMEASRRIMAPNAGRDAPAGLKVSANAQREAQEATDRLITEARAKVVRLTRPLDRATAKAPVADKPKAAPRRSVKAPAEQSVDDLKAIGGIGPKLERALNAMGFTRYAQIAALSGDEIARIEAEMGFSGRIGRDGWVAQANRLAAEQSKA